MYRGLLPAIRTLEVNSRHYDELLKESSEILTRLADMLPGMTGLRDLDWQVGQTTGQHNLKRTPAVPIPAPIMQLLPPELRLHTSVFCAYSKESHAQAREFFNCLANKQNLRTLSVQISFIEEQDCLETMRALKKALLSCPNLTRLPLLDIWYPREGAKGLRTAELWFPLGVEPPAPRPFLTISSARHLFSYLRERNESIQRLILHSGAPVPPVASFFASLISREPSWAMRNSITFVCNMIYDGDAEERRLSVTCPDLSTDMNAQLSRLTQQADRDRINPRELHVDRLRLKTALDGPLTMDEWDTWQHEQRVRGRKAYREQNTVLGRLVIGPFKRVLER
ncbi:hypothetical protein DL764_008149 [Monosporascus ibericus]|uniref:Uncharacterized protein n=1 Tax=Monosporascus ibericus TaxID=155417 RepID=A0A4Q4SY85_9PEZI|nr:hypothetical protein DL764_008149 [Monosporascus ibericus]